MATQRDNPYGSFNFLVDFATGDATTVRGGFQEVSGMNIEVTSADYRNGNSPNNHPVKVNGVYKVGDVTFKRGLIGSTRSLRAGSTRSGRAPARSSRPSRCSLQDEAHEGPKWIWKLLNARPIQLHRAVVEREDRDRCRDRGARPLDRGPDRRVTRPMTTSTLTFHGRLPGVDCDRCAAGRAPAHPARRRRLRRALPSRARSIPPVPVEDRQPVRSGLRWRPRARAERRRTGLCAAAGHGPVVLRQRRPTLLRRPGRRAERDGRPLAGPGPASGGRTAPSGRCSWTRRGPAPGRRASRWAPSCSASRWPSPATTCRPARTGRGCCPCRRRRVWRWYLAISSSSTSDRANRGSI